MHSAHAASIEVTSNLDDGTECTLREALTNTNSGVDQPNGCMVDTSVDALGSNDTITFAPNVSGSTITLANGELVISRSVSINPNGTTTIDANQDSRVMAITGGNVILDHLVITGGDANIDSGGIDIGNSVTSASLSDSTVSENLAIAGNGTNVFSRSSANLSNIIAATSNHADEQCGIAIPAELDPDIDEVICGGGVYVTGINTNVSVRNSKVSGNSAAFFGGGIFSAGGSSVSLSNSTVSQNLARFGGGIGGLLTGSVSLSNSTVSENSAIYLGGGILAAAYDSPAGVNTFNLSVKLNNSTVSGNSVFEAGSSELGAGGGIAVFGLTNVSLSNSTVSGNLAEFGAGFFASGTSNISLNNSIVANSNGIDSNDECITVDAQSTITVGADSIIDDTSCGGGTIADPLLGPLADNGGPTLTHALLLGSPAIDNLNAVGGSALDQRGFRVVGGVRDIGAFEYAPTLDLTVTSIEDDNGAGCTLREAIATSNAQTDLANGCYNIGTPGGGDTITFAANVAGNTITLANGHLDITRSVSINPNGASTTVDANQASRVMFISGGDVALDHLVITGGLRTAVGLGSASGGGLFIRNSGTSVSLSNSIVSGNSAADTGGGIHLRGSSSVSLNNSTVSGNSAGDNGGGIHARDSSSVSLSDSNVSGNSASDTGGGLFARSSSSVSLNNSTVSDNSTASDGGGIFARGSSSASVNNSTVTGNSATEGGGGVYVTDHSSVNFSNSTVSGNLGGFAGGGIATLDSSSVSLNNSTVADNSAIFGSGVAAFDSSTVSLSNSIVANSNGTNSADECFNSASTIAIGVDSIVDDSSCGGGTIADPLLDILADNGGPTLTHALLPGSPAIDNATATVATEIDQRGFAVVGVRDSGAFEAQRLSLSLSPNIVNESDGSGMGTVARTVLIDRALTVMLSSDDPTSVTVPSSVTIPAGAASATFSIIIVDNAVMNPANVSTITVNSIGYIESVANITVLDDDDDIDGDGVPNDSDNCPVTANADQADFEGDGIGDACDLDTDGDGLPDDYELANGLDPRNSLDRDADPDGDGFTNLEEFEFGSNPQVADTDANNNGVPDAVENRVPVIIPILQLLLLDDELG